MKEHNVPKQKYTIGLILNWLFGGLFTLVGVVTLFSEPIPAIAMLFIAAVLLPPITTLIYRKWNFKLSKAVKLFIIISGLLIVGLTSEDSNNSQIKNKETENDIVEITEKPDTELRNGLINININFDKLREWYPDNDLSAIGLEILVSRDDVTKENIIKLAESISSKTQKAVVKFYQSKEAWAEEKSGSYTEVYDQDYLAFYVKNLTGKGAYNGLNEIRWMQAEGDLQDLTTTILGNIEPFQENNLKEYKVVTKVEQGSAITMRIAVQKNTSKDEIIEINNDLINTYSKGLTHLNIDYFDDEEIAKTYFDKINQLTESEADELFKHYRATYKMNNTSGMNVLSLNENNNWTKVKEY
jgi:hypothetical protein